MTKDDAGALIFMGVLAGTAVAVVYYARTRSENFFHWVIDDTFKESLGPRPRNRRTDAGHRTEAS